MDVSATVQCNELSSTRQVPRSHHPKSPNIPARGVSERLVGQGYGWDAEGPRFDMQPTAPSFPLPSPLSIRFISSSYRSQEKRRSKGETSCLHSPKTTPPQRARQALPNRNAESPRVSAAGACSRSPAGCMPCVQLDVKVTAAAPCAKLVHVRGPRLPSSVCALYPNRH